MIRHERIHGIGMIEPYRMADLMGERVSQIVNVEVSVKAGFPDDLGVEANIGLIDLRRRSIPGSIFGRGRSMHDSLPERLRDGRCNSPTPITQIRKGSTFGNILRSDDNIGGAGVGRLDEADVRNRFPGLEGGSQLSPGDLQRNLRGLRDDIAEGVHRGAIAR